MGRNQERYQQAWKMANPESSGKGAGEAKGLSLMQNTPLIERSSLRISRDYTVNISEGGRLFQLEGQALTGFKGTMQPRSAITTFSRRSRWELQKRMAIIDEERAGVPDFLTLTYPLEWSDDWRVWKRDLDVMRKALIREWPEMWGCWRLEFQERGAPHFHCLVWDGPKVEAMEVWDGNAMRKKIIPVPSSMSEHNKKIFEWLSGTWFRVCGTGDPKHLAAGTRIEPIQSWNGVVYYASKYLAKLPTGDFAPVEYTGRFWGVFQPGKWKTWIHKQSVPEAAFYLLRRVLRKKREKLIGGKKYIEPGCGITDISLKSDMGFKLLVWAYREMRENENLKHAPF